jgi:hypothetical protein
MAFGATAVFAGVIGIAHVAAMVIAFFQMPSHLLRTTGGYGEESPLVVLGHAVAEFIKVLRTMFSDDFRQLDHGWRLAIMPLRLT